MKGSKFSHGGWGGGGVEGGELCSRSTLAITNFYKFSAILDLNILFFKEFLMTDKKN